MEMELEVSSRLLIGHETLLPKRVKHNLQDDDISSSVHELTQVSDGIVCGKIYNLNRLVIEQCDKIYNLHRIQYMVKFIT